MRVKVEEQACIAAGQCVVASPDVFDQRDDDGIVVLLNDNPSDELIEDVRHAASVCPARAIILDQS